METGNTRGKGKGQRVLQISLPLDDTTECKQALIDSRSGYITTIHIHSHQPIHGNGKGKGKGGKGSVLPPRWWYDRRVMVSSPVEGSNFVQKK